MKRSDKEITDREHLGAIIRNSLVCRLALARDNVPYLVPMSFGYDGAAIYLHTAPEGRKIGFFETNPQVCFEFERHVELRRDPQSACKWSFNFESVIGYGTLGELVEPALARPDPGHPAGDVPGRVHTAATGLDAPATDPTTPHRRRGPATPGGR